MSTEIIFSTKYGRSVMMKTRSEGTSLYAIDENSETMKWIPTSQHDEILSKIKAINKLMLELDDELQKMCITKA